MNNLNNLPRHPGLSRRLAYGNYIRNRHRRQLSIIGSGLGFTERYSYDEDTYETFSELKRVEIGLDLRQLMSISSIIVDTEPFFCVICQEDIPIHNQNDCIIISRRLVCHHKFHIQCIETWLSKNTSCPVCRCDLSRVI
jgi:hypothetical protein